LTWRLGALGDSLLLLPTLAALRAQLPAHRIIAAGHPELLAPALWQGLADELVDAAAPRFAPLFSGDAPAAGALPTDVEAALVWSARHHEMARGLARAGVPRVVGAPILPSGPTPMVLHYLAGAAALGVAPVPFTLHPPHSAVEATADMWRSITPDAGGPVALLHPGAGSRFKRWPLEHFLALAARLRRDGVAIAWTAGPTDDEIREALCRAGEAGSTLPPLNLEALAAVARRATVVVSADCGVAHLAALLGVPAVALFGPTDHRVWGPPGARSSVLHLGLPCAPCGEIMRRCPSRICLRGLTVDAVYAAVRARLDAGRAAPYPASEDSAPLPCAPSRPAEFHPRAPAPAPPAPLQVARWGAFRTWAAQPPSVLE
jgi:ADP-heptose:LPS heptosyltransferase